ncbi:MAG: lysine--tRNA ligase [Thermoplasmata archaeon]
MHWFDELYPSIEAFLADQEQVVCNAGLSVSGLQHVGRLRGEIVLNHFIAARLRAAGRTVTQHLVLYTQDRWKGSPEQVARFRPGEGGAYAGYRMIEVPDPHGCHANWVEHYWDGFAGPMERFAPGVVVTRTTDLYRTEEMQALVRQLADRADEVREIVNRYRPRNPHPRGWIPFEPLCLTCRRIGESRALGFTDGEVEYACECGGKGSSPLELGKLNWRIEWPALWSLLQVDVEPFGKDHATPGGSRETSQVLVETVLGIRAPFGIPYEWVGYAHNGEDQGDMDSSGFVGFGPETWLELADPEVLRFLFASVPIRRRLVLDLAQVDAYHQRYDQAEAAHYEGSEDEASRAYLLAQLAPPPEEAPFQLPYRHASLLAQVAPADDRAGWALARLNETGLLAGESSAWERDRIARRLDQARRWAQAYAPALLRVEVQRELPAEAAAGLEASEKEALGLLHAALSDVPWQEGAIKEAMVRLTQGGDLPVSTKRFFAALYTVLLGKPSGPRAAPLLAVLDRTFVLGRLEEASGG